MRPSLLGMLLVIASAGCPGKSDPTTPTRTPAQTGLASYYARSLAGHPTASGEPYDPKKLTAAHRTLPLGTRVRVTNIDNQATVEVRINDRGPFVEGRIIDVSTAAARELGMTEKGVVPVEIEVLSRP